MYPYRLLMIFREKLPKMDKIQESADRQLMGHFRKISLFFGDTRDNQEHGAKNRLYLLPVLGNFWQKKTDLKHMKIFL